MHDPKKNVDVEINLEDGIKNLKDNGDICVRERQPEEIEEIMKINNAHETAYLHVFQKNFSENYDGISFSKLDGTSKGRLMLVSSVIKTINDMDHNPDTVKKDMENYLREEPSYISRKPFLKEQDVEENVIEENINYDNNIISKEKTMDL